MSVYFWGLMLGGAAVVVIGVATTGIFKKQAAAWIITALMVVVAVFIGLVKSPLNSLTPDLPSQTIPPAVPEPVTPASPASFVWDDAGVLSSQTVRTLNARNDKLWAAYGVTIGVTTCNYGGDDPYTYVTKLFADMGLGSEDMIVVLDISGDDYWMYTGDRVARQFSDEDCSSYTYDYMESWFAQGDYDTAVLSLTEALETWYGVYYFI